MHSLFAFLFTAFFLVGCSDSNPVDSDSEGLLGDAQLVANTPFMGNSPVVISEINTVNLVYKDHEGGDAGWVELYNRSSNMVNLSGVSLTDNPDKPAKWKFGNVKMAPNSFMIVFMSGKDLPDFVAPHDSVNMIGSGCAVWTDAQNEEEPGESYANPLDGKKDFCFKENGKSMFGTKMRLMDNALLGWSLISAFVGTKSSAKNDVVDISNTNEILLNAYITKDRQVSMRLAQPDYEEWNGYEFVLTGTGDSSSVYRLLLPQGLAYPDLKRIYGTSYSPEEKEVQEVEMKVFSYIARNRGHEPHASFKLDKNGGRIFLVNSMQEILDSVEYPELPPEKSWSLGTLDDGVSASFGYSDPSPYDFTKSAVDPSRSPSLDTLIKAPSSGFYSASFKLSFPKDAAVRCAKDGNAPTAQSSVKTSLKIDSTVTIRCASFVSGALAGEELVRTYIFEDAPTLPAVFLTADPNSLFSPDSGIYMEGPNAREDSPYYGANYWLDKEIPVYVELVESGAAKPGFAKAAGLKIFGNFSRIQEKKSVAITFREQYGDKRLNYKLFPEFPKLKEFKSFVLRNNGNNFKNDYIRDRLASSISEGLGVDYQRGRFAVVYYNGEYYGIHDLRERSNEHYFETHYGMDPDDIDLLDAKNNVSSGNASDYIALMDWLQSNHLNDKENYAYISSQIDIDNYLNYMHTELFADNRDWPANNLKKWRNANLQTKWKWFLYDLDYGFDNGENMFTYNIFTFAAEENGYSWPNGPEHTFLLRRLLENSEFKAAFINRLAVLLQTNFGSSRVLARVDEMMTEIEKEIPRDQKRWNHNVSEMDSHLDRIKEFIRNRASVLTQELQEYFVLKKVAPVTLTADGPGRILVHNLPVDESKLTVNFFKGFPVTLSAEAQSGHSFVGWSDGETSPQRVIKPENASEVTALFE